MATPIKPTPEQLDAARALCRTKGYGGTQAMSIVRQLEPAELLTLREVYALLVKPEPIGDKPAEPPPPLNLGATVDAVLDAHATRENAKAEAAKAAADKAAKEQASAAPETSEAAASAETA